jgi:ribosomal protein S18 acetylase RimI-like enzyme
MQVEIREPRTPEEFRSYYWLRWKVLREPWTQDRESEKDHHENDAVHLMACLGDQVLGVGRLHFNSPDQAQIRFMAVEPEYVRRGVGSAVLKELEARARQIVLNARDPAVFFYQKHGYEILGQSETLFEAIPHTRMGKAL